MKKLKLKLLATLSLFFFLGSVCLVAQTERVPLNETPKQVLETPKVTKKVDFRGDKLQQIKELNLQEEKLLQQPMTDEIADKLEAIQSERVSLRVRKTVKPEKHIAVRSNDLRSKVYELNKKFAAKGIDHKAIITTVNGKQYIEYVATPEQNGVNPVKKK